ncbi:hypothetical protein [Enterococcus thailandicus]|uniref:hypothetical protein n=1 Tax=Enterococcus thailandicus TaxID=417368 RepID=UPI0022E6D211|nr:hypothetical protein [Enterococcus thailandicus]
MQILAVIDNDEKSTFFVACLDKKSFEVERILPMYTMNDKTISQIYKENSMEDFIAILNGKINYRIENFIVISINVLIDVLFSLKSTVIISNKKNFIHIDESSGKKAVFPKGKMELNKCEIYKYLEFIPEELDYDAFFSRQEHVLRLVKNELTASKNPIVIQKKYKELRSHIQTNLTVGQVLKLLTIYVSSEQKKINKKTLA